MADGAAGGTPPQPFATHVAYSAWLHGAVCNHADKMHSMWHIIVCTHCVVNDNDAHMKHTTSWQS